MSSALLLYFSTAALSILMLSGISIICFAACYPIAFALELASLRRRSVANRIGLLCVTLAGLVAHTLYLFGGRTIASALPLSTAEWLLWAAWLLVIVYITVILYLPRSPTGIGLLPIALGLIFSSRWANPEPFASEHSLRIWGVLHGWLLLVGTVAVCIGFLAGLMYLLQSYAL